MCWFSAEHANQIAEAKAGQRLGIKQMNWHANWVVCETEFEAARPTPVCLIDQTKVLFRFSERDQKSLHLGPEAEAVFRMSRLPKRDVFEFLDGREIPLSELPAHLIFDVLVVPGSEQDSAFLNMQPAGGGGRGGERERTSPSPIAGTVLEAASACFTEATFSRWNPAP